MTTYFPFVAPILFLTQLTYASDDTVRLQQRKNHSQVRSIKFLDNEEQWTVVRKLGGGREGLVFLAKPGALSLRRLAIKILTDYKPGFEETLNSINTLLDASGASHVVRYYARHANVDGAKALVVSSKYVAGTTLDTKRIGFKNPVNLADRIVSGLLPTMADLVEAGVVHNDLSPRNVLITAQSAIAIDYGLAALRGDKVGASTLQNPFVAPEVGEVRANPAYDAWSLAALVLSAYLEYGEMARMWSLQWSDEHSPAFTAKLNDSLETLKSRFGMPEKHKRLIVAGLTFSDGDRLLAMINAVPESRYANALRNYLGLASEDCSHQPFWSHWLSDWNSETRDWDFATFFRPF